MNFYVITIFPEVITSYTNESIIKRAVEKKLIKVSAINPRGYTLDKHRKVDDKGYGGGPGMVLKVEPILRAISSLKLKTKDSIIIITSAAGRVFDDKTSIKLSKKYKNIVIICGRYEGIDERVKQVLKKTGFKVEEISIGNYVLTGGELPALVMLDSISRKIRGVLGKEESLEENRFGVGVPTYTRPEEFKYRNKVYKVPKVLLSGHHAEIDKWRMKKASFDA